MKDTLILFAFGACAFCAAISGALHAAPVATLLSAGLSAPGPTPAAAAAPDEADPDAKPPACQPAPAQPGGDAID